MEPIPHATETRSRRKEVFTGLRRLAEAIITLTFALGLHAASVYLGHAFHPLIGIAFAITVVLGAGEILHRASHR